MQSILFVCTGNQCRSPIAAALFENLMQQKGFSIDDWRIESAGTWTKSGLLALPACQKLAKSLEIDISNHRTRSITDISLDAFDIVVVMEQGHYEALSLEFPDVQDKLFLLSNLAGKRGYSIPDPLLTSPENARDIVRGLSEYMHLAFDVICDTALKMKQPDADTHLEI